MLNADWTDFKIYPANGNPAFDPKFVENSDKELIAAIYHTKDYTFNVRQNTMEYSRAFPACIGLVWCSA